MGHHGDSHGRRHRRVGDDVRGQPRRFGSEEEGVRFAVGDVGEAVRRVPGEGEDARIRERAKERLEVGVDSKVCKVVVIQSRALEVRVFEGEAQGFDEVEPGARACCQPNRRPRVSGDSRLVEDDVKHQLSVHGKWRARLRSTRAPRLSDSCCGLADGAECMRVGARAAGDAAAWRTGLSACASGREPQAMLRFGGRGCAEPSQKAAGAAARRGGACFVWNVSDPPPILFVERMFNKGCGKT